MTSTIHKNKYGDTKSKNGCKCLHQNTQRQTQHKDTEGNLDTEVVEHILKAERVAGHLSDPI